MASSCHFNIFLLGGKVRSVGWRSMTDSIYLINPNTMMRELALAYKNNAHSSEESVSIQPINDHEEPITARTVVPSEKAAIHIARNAKRFFHFLILIYSS